MFPDSAQLKPLMLNASGLNALLDYLEALHQHYDEEYTQLARQLVFAPEAHDKAAVLFGRLCEVADLRRSIESLANVHRGDKQ